jgi:hypothetical protein
MMPCSRLLCPVTLPHCSKPSSGSQERWTDEEHAKFVEAVNLYGRQWRRIERESWLGLRPLNGLFMRLLWQ